MIMTTSTSHEPFLHYYTVDLRVDLSQ